MSTADQIRVAELTGAARHHARWRELTPDEHDAAGRPNRILRPLFWLAGCVRLESITRHLRRGGNITARGAAVSEGNVKLAAATRDIDGSTPARSRALDYAVWMWSLLEDGAARRAGADHRRVAFRWW
jgi:hypothetical protein